jgi:hypothetical protein
VHPLPTQRTTVIEVAFVEVLAHVRAIRRLLLELAVRFDGAVGTATGSMTLVEAVATLE